MSGTGVPTRDLTSGRLLARNVGLNLGGSLLPALAALIAVPFLVRGLGDARFGILALAWTALGYFSLFDLGIGRAVTHASATRIGEQRSSEIGAVLWTSLAFLMPVGLAAGGALFFGAPWLTTQLLEVPAHLLRETTIAFQVLALAIPFAVLTAALRAPLEAKQYFGVINSLRVPGALVMFLGPVAALPFSRSVLPGIIIITASRILLCLAHVVVAARLVPGFVTSQVRWNGRTFGELISFGGWMTVSNFVSPLMTTVDRFVLAAVLGVNVVTYYATPSELVTKMWLFTAALHPVFFPALTTASTTDREETARLFSRLLRMTFGALLLPTAVLVILAPEILRVWLGPTFAVQSATVLQVLAIAVFVNTLGQGALTLVQAVGRPDITGKLYLIELPLYATLLAYLLPRYGILGVAVAWALRAVVDAVAMLLTCPVLVRESRSIVQRMLAWLALVVPLLTLGMFVPGTTPRIAVTAVAIPVIAAVAWWWMLTPEERRAPQRLLSAAWRTTSA